MECFSWFFLFAFSGFLLRGFSCDDLFSRFRGRIFFQPFSKLRKPLLDGTLGADVARDAMAWLERANSVLGFIETGAQSADAEVEALIEERTAAKAAKDWAAADAALAALAALGIEIQDTPEGVVWRRR